MRQTEQKQLAKWFADNPQLPTLVEVVDMIADGLSAQYWYSDTRAEIVRVFGPDSALFTRILAATSPRKSVKANLTEALRVFSLIRPYIDNYEAERPEQFSKFEAHNLNLFRISKGEALSGLKVRAFCRALLGDCQAVTVDMWIAKAFNINRPLRVSDFVGIEYVIKEATGAWKDREYSKGHTRTLSPAQAQACIWHTIRKRSGLTESNSFAYYLKQLKAVD